VANEKPFLVYYQGKLYVPIFTAYAETTFGGDFPTEADYRDLYVAQLIGAKGWMVWPLVRYNYRTVAWDLPTPAPSAPDATHWLGTDDQARDVVARLIYGFRISVLFGFVLTVLSVVMGVAAGWADENQRYGDKICIGERRNFCSRARSQLRGICYCVCVRFWVK